MYRYTVPLFVFAMSIACFSGKDDDDTATLSTTNGCDSDADTDADADSDTDPSAGVDSCVWSLGLCFEFTDFDSTADFCNSLESAYGASADYAAEPCPSGEVFVCSVPGVSIYGGGPAADEPAMIYYYGAFQSDPATACSDAGGSPM